MLTQKRLREVMSYDPMTGAFTWTRGKRRGKVAGTRHDARGFTKVAIANERHLLHRLAWLWMTGSMPRWDVIHANGDHSDNRWANLREGDRMQHAASRAPWREPTDIQGVSKVGDRFEAEIGLDGVVLNLGSYATAVDARNAIVETVHGEFFRAA